LGLTRQIIGWLTMGFLIIGFTPNPVSISTPENRPASTAPAERPPAPPAERDNLI
jgi:hypothetical protein